MVGETSRAFEEFTINRCEEVTMGDEGFVKLEKECIKVSKDLVSALTQEQIRLFFDYEKAISRLQAYSEKLLYKKGLEDIIKVFKA